MSSHYKNNGEQCCQFCHAYMTEEEYNFCDICPNCRDENEYEEKDELAERYFVIIKEMIKENE